MSFLDEIRNIKKGPEDHKKDLADLVRNLPGVQDILDWRKRLVSDFEVEDDGKKFTVKYGMGILTISIEDEQYRVEYREEDVGRSEERRYDAKSKVETERTVNDRSGESYRCVRDKNNLEEVDVYGAYGDSEMKKIKSCDIAAPLGSISKGKKFDIATLDACGGLKTLGANSGSYRRYQDCQDFTKRNMVLVRQAVEKSKYPQQCYRYDGTVQEMDKQIQV